MGKRDSVAMIFLIVVIVLAVAGGVWYYAARRVLQASFPTNTQPTTMVSSTLPIAQLVSSRVSQMLADASDTTTSSILAAVTDWSAYKAGPPDEIEADTDCAPSDPQFASYLNQINEGQVFAQTIGGYIILYTPNYYDWTEGVANQKSRGSLCKEGDLGLIHAYPDKLIWAYGCGGSIDPACAKVESVVDSYFASLASSISP